MTRSASPPAVISTTVGSSQRGGAGGAGGYGYTGATGGAGAAGTTLASGGYVTGTGVRGRTGAPAAGDRARERPPAGPAGADRSGRRRWPHRASAATRAGDWRDGRLGGGARRRLWCGSSRRTAGTRRRGRDRGLRRGRRRAAPTRRRSRAGAKPPARLWPGSRAARRDGRDRRGRWPPAPPSANVDGKIKGGAGGYGGAGPTAGAYGGEGGGVSASGRRDHRQRLGKTMRRRSSRATSASRAWRAAR